MARLGTGHQITMSFHKASTLHVCCLAWLSLSLLVASTGCLHRGHPHEKQTHEMLDDKVMAARVVGALRNTGSTTNVEVSVKEGVVTLNGTVKNAQQEEQAREAAQSVDGIKKVINNLAIQP